MADDTELVILTQPEEERLRLDHAGAVGVHGDDDRAPLRHRFHGDVEHTVGTADGHPLVHVVAWDTRPCEVEVSGRVALTGDPDAPVPVEMTHEFKGLHHQHFEVDPLDHTLRVDSALAEPVHHALQMRTPLEVRFCNPWQIDADYTVDIRLSERPFLSIHLRGSTRATPEPCEERPCPPIRAQVMHP